jgi:glycosyltransferase involved in cell wall biosynthesis
MSVRVLVDAVSASIGGGRTLAREQLAALDAIPGVELTVYAASTMAAELALACPNAKVRRCPRKRLSGRILWEQLVLPARARDHDVIYALGNFALFFARRPQLVVEHNMSHFTEHVRRFRRERCSRRLRVRLALESTAARASVRRAERVVAVSETMRAAIESDLGRVAGLRVVSSTPSRYGPAQVRKPDRLPVPATKPYVLAVAHDYPHKDWDGLVATFLRRNDLPSLVIVGACTDARRKALSARLEAEDASDRVRLLGAMEDAERLDELYRGAHACVAHSFYESFGFTVCEALQQGTPVAAADIPAYREVCGDAASYYQPEDHDALAEAVHRASVAGVPTMPDTPAFNRTWSTNAHELMAIVNELARPRAPQATSR